MYAQWILDNRILRHTGVLTQNWHCITNQLLRFKNASWRVCTVHPNTFIPILKLLTSSTSSATIPEASKPRTN